MHFIFRVRSGAKKELILTDSSVIRRPERTRYKFASRICIERPGPYPAGNLPPAGFILFSSPSGNKKTAHPNGWTVFLATPNGLEPSTSSVTGWRANRLHHRAKFGGNNRARTCDLLLVRQMLSQLSYAPNCASSVLRTSATWFIIHTKKQFVKHFFRKILRYFGSSIPAILH